MLICSLYFASILLCYQPVPVVCPKPVEYEITSYCLSGTMANGEIVHNGAVACPANLSLGTKLTIEWGGFINNEFTCEDRMGLKYRHGKYIDIWVGNCDIAMNFGRRKLLVNVK